MRQLRFDSLKFLPASAFALIGAGLVMLLCSCYPSSDFDSVKDYDVVLTQYDDQQDFAEYVTFFVDDSVYHYQDPDDTSDDNVPRNNDALIIATIKANMIDLGYQYKANASSLDPSDILVVIGVTSSDWYSVWYPWYGGGWWGWGGWYPYAPQVTYAYTTGTIFIDLWDIKNADEEAGIAPITWYARINGLANDTSSGVSQRIEDSIDQAFAQSPYLGRP